jgi:hypothetical protein
MVFGISLWIMRRQGDNSAIQSEFNPQIIYVAVAYCWFMGARPTIDISLYHD